MTKKLLLLSFVLFNTPFFNAKAQPSDSLDIKIGQMILVGMTGKSVSPNSSIIKDIKSHKIGGVILYEKNIPKSNSFINFKKMIWSLQQASEIPLFLTIDQEGGKVNRLKEKYGFPKSVSAAYLSRTRSLDSARFYNDITASTLAGLGINVNFAPVVDLASNPKNPIIAKYERAYSADPDIVSVYAAEAVRSHRKFNVITVLKHFPGHGSSHADTHLGIADVTKYWSEQELLPYENLIKEGSVDAIMTAHIVNKNLDKQGLPGTLSKDIMSGLLRGKLKYQGVIFSDDMQMHAIASHYGLEKSIQLSILAGVDVLMFSNNIQGSENRTAQTVHSLIKKMVKTGVISEERIDQSFERIMKLKSKLQP